MMYVCIYIDIEIYSCYGGISDLYLKENSSKGILPSPPPRNTRNHGTTVCSSSFCQSHSKRDRCSCDYRASNFYVGSLILCSSHGRPGQDFLAGCAQGVGGVRGSSRSLSFEAPPIPEHGAREL